jgi:hypothetical protein
MEPSTAVYSEINQRGIQEAKLPPNPYQAAAVQPEVKGSTAIFWVLGGAAALVLTIGGFLILAAGIYFYSVKGRDLKTQEYPPPAVKSQPPVSSNPALDQPQKDSAVITDETIKDYFQSRKKIGKFNLLQVFDKRSTEFFPNADAAASAFYSSGGKKEHVIINMTTYASKDKARTEFSETFKREKQAGARNIKDYYESENEIGATYQRGVVYVLNFCSFRNESRAYCYRMVSPDKAALVEFHGSFFKN